MCGKNTHSLLIGMQTGTATLETNTENSEKLKINILNDPSISVLVICSKDPISYSTITCITIVIFMLFTIARK